MAKKLLTPNKQLVGPTGQDITSQRTIRVSAAEIQRRQIEQAHAQMPANLKLVVDHYADKITAIADAAAADKTEYPQPQPNPGLMMPAIPPATATELFEFAMALVGSRLACPTLTEPPKE